MIRWRWSRPSPTSWISAATLRWATEVEHATIPPYEYAFWSVMERVWRSENHGPLVDGAMVPLMNRAQKPIALALLREPWPDGSGEVAGPPFAWDPMSFDDVRSLARRLASTFELGPTVETLDRVAATLGGSV